MRVLSLVVLSGVAILTACVGTDGISPKSALLDAAGVATGAQINAVLENARWPQDRWWTRWSDPQLDRLVSQSIAKNPEMDIAQARLEQAEASAQIAGAAREPVISGSGVFSRRRFAAYDYPRPPGGSTVWNNTASLDLAYDVDLWGKNRATLQGALNSVQAAAADARESRLVLETSVVRVYVELSLQYELRDNQSATLAREQRIQDIVKRRVRAGLASRLELSEARTPIAATRAQIEQIDRQIALARNQLSTLIGQGPAVGDHLNRPTLRLEVQLALPANLPAELVGHRPDVVAQRWRVEAASQGIKAAKADFYPNINLIASAGLASAAFGGFFTFVNNDALEHSFGAAISLPIFDGGQRKGRYGVAVASYDLAVDTYNRTVLAAFHDVADQVVSLRSLAQQQVEVETSLQSAKEAFDYADKGYRVGMTDYLNVLATETELLHAQQSLAAVRAARLDAWAQLMMSLGGGVEGSLPTDHPNMEGTIHAP